MPYLRRPQKIRDNTLLVRKGFQVGVVLGRGFRHMVGVPLIPLGQKFQVVSGISMDKRIASKLYRVIHEKNVMSEQGDYTEIFTWIGLSPTRREFILPHKTNYGLFEPLPFPISCVEVS